MKSLNGRQARNLILASLGVLVFLCLLPASTLLTLYQHSPLTLVGAVVPAVERLAAVSRFPDYTRLAVALQWALIPAYVYLIVRTGRARLASQDKNIWQLVFPAGARTKSILAFAFFGMLLVSDVFDLRYPSFFRGTALAQHGQQGLFAAVGSVKPIAALTYWAFSIVEALMMSLIVLMLLDLLPSRRGDRKQPTP